MTVSNRYASTRHRLEDCKGKPFVGGRQDEDILFLEGKCLSYSRGVGYYPITDILKANFGIEDQDTDASITEKVKIALEANGLTIPFPQRDIHMINQSSD